VTLSAGTTLGPYEIQALLGAGGMGEVYKARDTRLGRAVAVKVLPARLSSDPEGRRRLEREARTISQISHPNICALYDVGREGETDYLVMEYLEGETLADRLERGALPLEQALLFGTAIAEALDKAHRHGVVHRDLKPGNVMLTKTGVKLLDFGLAKAMEPAAPAPNITALPTQANLTQEGTILGTVQYMAPEQLEGREADARTDIFAFGAVLYEMATGRKAFPGASQATIMSAILKEEPPSISKIQPRSPASLDRLVGTCLAKDPERRWQSAADVARELDWIARGGQAQAGPAAPGRRGARLAWAAAAVAAAVAVAALVWPRRAAPAAELTRLTILPPPGLIFFGQLALSPDARRVLALLQDDAGRVSVGVRSLDSLEVRRLPGAEDARGAFWSPDGREIAFFSEGKLKRMSADGGPAREVCDSGAAFSGAWGAGGTILFTKEFGQALVAVAATGGSPQPATTLDSSYGENWHGHPAFLPDGRHFVFVARSIDLEKTSVMLGSLGSRTVRRLFPSDTSAIYAEPGYLVFGRGGSVFAWRFDPRRLELIGEPAPILEHARALREDNYLSASTSGDRLGYLTWFGRRRLVWVDRKGRELGTVGEIGGYTDVRLSPDGTRAAVTRRDPSHGQNQDTWVLDLERGTALRLTSEPNEEFDPAWSPDGEQVIYVSDRLGFFDLYERPAAGGAEKTLVTSQQDKVLPSVSPDGRRLLVSVSGGGRFARMLLPYGGEKNAQNLSGDSRFSEQHPAFSPDGRWTAFDSNESGRREVYVQPFPEGPVREVSVGGGQFPVWSRDGSELFFEGRDGMLMATPLRPSSGRLEIGEPQPLFVLQLGTAGELLWYRHPFDVSPDGRRFLVIRRAADAEADGAVLVSNWTELLKPGR
jgi:Tol biopolymer transport system component